MIVQVDTIEAGDTVDPMQSGPMVVTHVTRDGKGRHVLRMEMELHYQPDQIISLVRKVGT